MILKNYYENYSKVKEAYSTSLYQGSCVKDAVRELSRSCEIPLSSSLSYYKVIVDALPREYPAFAKVFDKNSVIYLSCEEKDDLVNTISKQFKIFKRCADEMMELYLIKLSINVYEGDGNEHMEIPEIEMKAQKNKNDPQLDDIKEIVERLPIVLDFQERLLCEDMSCEPIFKITLIEKFINKLVSCIKTEKVNR
jgi:hypothetical protein